MSRTTSMRLASLLLALGGIAGVASAQQVLSAQSGTIHYIEGPVYLDGQQLRLKFGQFPALRLGQELRTDTGRAEVLLTPGAFLRVSDHSAIRMLDNRLSDTRVEILAGSVIAECDALLKDNSITLLYAGNTIHLDKHGLYRIDTAPAQLRVYDGEAVVQSASGDLTVKRGKETPLDGVLLAEKFNRKLGDGFYLWDSNRSGLLAAASLNASQTMLNNNTSWNTGGWGWSPYYNMFTFVPGGSSMIYSPFGWQFWSPTVLAIYTPYYANRGSNGYGVQNSGGSVATNAGAYSGRTGMSSAPSAGSGGGFGSAGISPGGSRGAGGGGASVGASRGK